MTTDQAVGGGAAGGGDQGQAAAAAAAAAGGQVGGQGGAAPWWDAIGDADLKAYAANKAWQSPAETVTSYRSLERMIGAEKAGRTVVMPADGAAPEEQAAFFDRLGRPVTADKYELPMPAEGADDKMAGWAKETFYELGLTGKQAAGVAAAWNEMAAGRVEAMKVEAGAKLEAEQTGLRREWGSAYEAKLSGARQAVAAFGVDARTIDALEEVMGFAGVMKHFDLIASKIGQQSFIGGEGGRAGGGFGALTPAQAQARIADLKKDKGFSDRLFKKDATAVAEWDRLHVQAHGEAA